MVNDILAYERDTDESDRISDEDVERIARRVVEMINVSEHDEMEKYNECYTIEEKEYTKDMTWWQKIKFFFQENEELRVLAAVRYYQTYGVELIDYGDIDKELVRSTIKMLEGDK